MGGDKESMGIEEWEEETGEEKEKNVMGEGEVEEGKGEK